VERLFFFVLLYTYHVLEFVGFYQPVVTFPFFFFSLLDARRSLSFFLLLLLMPLLASFVW
jgi:hypothetical protein